jgi:hypothetical protein
MDNPTIAVQLQAAITAQNLTLYGASQVVGADLVDLPLKTIHRRLSVMTADPPPQSIAQLEEVCSALGLTITIK